MNSYWTLTSQITVHLKGTRVNKDYLSHIHFLLTFGAFMYTDLCIINQQIFAVAQPLQGR